MWLTIFLPVKAYALYRYAYLFTAPLAPNVEVAFTPHIFIFE